MIKLVQKYKWYMIAFLISFLPRLIIALADPTQMRLIPDEIGMLAGTAHFAGLDWSNVVSTTGYYGIGYHVLFAPILMIVEDFVVFHTIVKLAAAFVCSLVAIIAFRIMTKFLGVKNMFFACAVSVACSYCMTTGIRNVSNEYILNLITWLAVYILLDLSLLSKEQVKKKRVLTAVLSLLMVYTLTIHTRSIILWGAIFAIVVLYFIVYKKILLSLPVFLGNISVGYVAARVLEKALQASIWITTSSDEPKLNTSSDLTNKITDSILGMFQPDNINEMIKIFFGNVYTLFYFTAGVMIIALVMGGYSIYNHIKHKEIFKDKEERGLDMIFWFSGICIFVVIAGLAVVWYPGVSKYMQGYDQAVYSYFTKAIVYTRYYACYTGPAVMACMIYLYRNGELVLKHFKKLALMLLILSVYWIKYVVEYLTGAKTNVREFFGATFSSYYNATVTEVSYVPAMILLFVLFAVIFICIRYKKVTIYATIVAIFLIYTKSYYDEAYMVSKYSMADAGTEFVKELETKNEALDRHIYVWGKSQSYAYQALLSRYTIINDLPEENVSEAVVFANKYEAGAHLEEWGYQMKQIDDDEYVWFKGVNY